MNEFKSSDGALGFAEAAPNDFFVKIGVGLLRKPDNEPYAFSRPYQIAGTGKWIVRPATDHVEFIHELKGVRGYSYRYTKTVRLAHNKPELILEYSLKNIGKRIIETEAARLQQKELVYTRPLQTGQSVSSYLTGYSQGAVDNDIRVENSKTHAGVEEITNLPISKLFLWSIKTTVCPEAYIALHVPPGKTTKWQTIYRFYTTEQTPKSK